LVFYRPLLGFAIIAAVVGLFVWSRMGRKPAAVTVVATPAAPPPPPPGA